MFCVHVSLFCLSACCPQWELRHVYRSSIIIIISTTPPYGWWQSGRWQSIVVRHFHEEDTPFVTHRWMHARKSGPVNRLTTTAAGASCTLPVVGITGWGTVAGERTSHLYTRLIEQTKSGASNFKLTKSRFWPSEAVQAKFDSIVRLGGRTRLGCRISRRSETGVVLIGALQTDIQTEAWVGVL